MKTITIGEAVYTIRNEKLYNSEGRAAYLLTDYQEVITQPSKIQSHMASNLRHAADLVGTRWEGHVSPDRGIYWLRPGARYLIVGCVEFSTIVSEDDLTEIA